MRSSGVQEAGRAAAHVDGIDSARFRGLGPDDACRTVQFRGAREFLLDRMGVGSETIGGHYAGVEVAVGAFRLAEGHLDVYA